MTKVEFAVVTDVYQAGYTDDGQPYTAERFYVQAEVEDGRRFRYHKAWNGCVATANHEDGGSFFEDVRPRAAALAEAVRRTVAKYDFNPNSDDWFEGRPAYGSDAFLAYQMESEMMEREEFDAGLNGNLY